MSECIAEIVRADDLLPKGEVIWHLVAGEGNSWWRPIRCGQGIYLPSVSEEREPTCPACLSCSGYRQGSGS